MTCSQCNSTGIFVPRMSTSQGGVEWITTYRHDLARTCPLCDGTGDQIRQWPFSCGTEAMDWKARNCDGCLKGYDENAGEWRCDLERSIDEGAIGNGTVPLDTYRRMGIDLGQGRCTEYVEDPPTNT